MENNKTATVGSFVANDYRTATVFQKYGIDFCCKGGRSIEEVCTGKNLDETKLLAELAAAASSAKDSATDFKTWSLDLLDRKSVV